jgi:hypothetical protein
MKKIVAICMAIVSFSILNAQKISVNDQSYTIDKIQRIGVATYLDLDKKFVEKLWKDELKKYGKVSSDKDIYYVEIAQMPSISTNNVRIISTIETSSKGVMVWMAIDLGTSFVAKGEKGYQNAVQLMKDFAKISYTEDINEQIKEAEKALEKSIKEQEKVVRQGEILQNDLTSNANEKQRLENELVNNANKKTEIENNIVTNKDDKTNADKEIVDMKKAVEVVRKKLEGVTVD